MVAILAKGSFVLHQNEAHGCSGVVQLWYMEIIGFDTLYFKLQTETL